MTDELGRGSAHGSRITTAEAAVIFIEPEYSDSPIHFGWTSNDHHPRTGKGPGENFLRPRCARGAA